MIPMDIIKALVQSGVMGAVLAWALLRDYHNTERMFALIENNTKALSAYSIECLERKAENGR